MGQAIETIVIGVYNAALIAATGYLVFWRDQSGWWFLLTIALMANSRECKEKE